MMAPDLAPVSSPVLRSGSLQPRSTGLLLPSAQGDPGKALKFLRSLRGLVELIGCEVYGDFERDARERLGERDPEDWPILAAALAIGCPIWTEDTDFFGCGVPTWTTSRVAMYLRDPQK